MAEEPLSVNHEAPREPRPGLLRRIFSPIGDIGLFLILILRRTRRDNIFLIASALAFVTILSMIPLLATFSFVGNRIFSQFEQQSLQFLGELLPYSDEAVIDRIRDFLAQAESLQGFALVFLFATALFAFATVEATLNRIWQVPKGRPFRVRLLSFTLLLFWGPVLIGASFAGLPFLGQLPGFSEHSFLLQILPHVTSLVGLTMLYWAVPYATVQFRAALAGGLLATALLILLRRGFAVYTTLFENVNLIYGSFAFTLLFMISIDLAWLIALIGSEIAYVAQHFRALSRGIHRELALEGRWAGLATLAVLTESFWRREPLVTHDTLADRLRVPPDELHRVLSPLRSNNWISDTAEPTAAYLLSTDPHHLTLAEVFRAYDKRCSEIFEPLGEETAGHLKMLVIELAASQRKHLERLTLADLVPEERVAAGLEPKEPEEPDEALETVDSASTL
jgi:membrane protein